MSSNPIWSNFVESRFLEFSEGLSGGHQGGVYCRIHFFNLSIFFSTVQYQLLSQTYRSMVFHWLTRLPIVMNKIVSQTVLCKERYYIFCSSFFSYHSCIAITNLICFCHLIIAQILNTTDHYMIYVNKILLLLLIEIC